MKKKDNYTVFEYNPKYKMRIATNEELRYDFDLSEFEINQNPMGEEKSKPIYHVEILPNYHQISFSTLYRNKEKSVVLKCRNKVDAVLYEFFSFVRENKLMVGENDLDRIEIIIINDLIDRIDIYKKNNECELLDSLCIVRKNDDLFIEKCLPSYSLDKIVCMKIDSNNNMLIDREDGMTDVYHIDSQTIIIDLMKEILDKTRLF